MIRAVFGVLFLTLILPPILSGDCCSSQVIGSRTTLIGGTGSQIGDAALPDPKSGNYLVISEVVEPVPGKPSELHLKAQAFSSALVAIGSSNIVYSLPRDPSGDHYSLFLAVSLSYNSIADEFLVVFSTNTYNTNAATVTHQTYAQRLSTDAIPIGSKILVANDPVDERARLQLIFSPPRQNYFLYYNVYGLPLNHHYLQLLDSSGTPVGQRRLLFTSQSSSEVFALIRYLQQSQKYLAVWPTTTTPINTDLFQYFDLDLKPVGAVHRISLSFYSNLQAVALQPGTDNFTVFVQGDLRNVGAITVSNMGANISKLANIAVGLSGQNVTVIDIKANPLTGGYLILYRLYQSGPYIARIDKNLQKQATIYLFCNYYIYRNGGAMLLYNSKAKEYSAIWSGAFKTWDVVGLRIRAIQNGSGC